jgi:hypothetical protein
MIEVEMTSLEIAELTGKRHDNVMRDIKTLLDINYKYSKFIKQTYYKNSRGKEYIMYTVSGELLEILLIKWKHNVALNSGKVGESIALTTIEQVKGIKLERQYHITTPCGKSFFIDGYDPVNNVAYEIDEDYHYIGDTLRPACVERQNEIEKVLGCKFVRIKL